MDERGSRHPLDLDLARRLQRALTASADGLFDVLEDPAMEVVRTALNNPALAADTLPTPIRLTLMPTLRLFELIDLLTLPWATPDQKLAAERQVIRRMPSMPLGHKLTLARRASPLILAELLREGLPQVMQVCLSNPHLKEMAVHQFLAGPNAKAESISAIARHPRWKSRPHLRLAILKHPQTPAVWYRLWLRHLPLPEVRNLLANRKLKGPQKRAIEEELERRKSS